MVEVTSSRLNWLSLLVRLNIGFTKVNIEHNWVKMNYQINLAWRMNGCIDLLLGQLLGVLAHRT